MLNRSNWTKKQLQDVVPDEVLVIPGVIPDSAIKKLTAKQVVSLINKLFNDDDALLSESWDLNELVLVWMKLNLLERQ